MNNCIGDAAEDRTVFSHLSTVLFYGALWGLLEATLGFTLHLAARATVLPPLAGFIMFPLGVAAMLAAVRACGRPAAALGVAMIAAAIKASSVLLPPVRWIFVQNPTIAILLEGLVLWGFVALFGFGRVGRSVTTTVALAFGAGVAWRLAFAAVQVGFGIRWGLLARGLTAVLGFVVIDSIVNGAIILVLLRASVPTRILAQTRTLLRPLPAVLSLAAAFTAEFVTSLL